MLSIHFHSLPSARVISVGPVYYPQNQVGVIGLTGMIQKGKARRVDSADTVCVQEFHLYLNVDGLRLMPADFLSVSSSTSLRVSMVCALATHQI